MKVMDDTIDTMDSRIDRLGPVTWGVCPVCKRMNVALLDDGRLCTHGSGVSGVCKGSRTARRIRQD